ANVSLNQDGSLVAFVSLAAFDAADTNGVSDIYLRNRGTNQTTQISVASDGTHANGASADPHVSADGRYVVFTSVASNLVTGVGDVPHVFLRDLVTLTTTLVGADATGVHLSEESFGGRISADGSIIAFVARVFDLSEPDCVPAFGCLRAVVLD